MFLLLLILIPPITGQGSCPAFFSPPSALMANETGCQVRSGPESGCTDCCPQNYICCDNGTCMEKDPFCRYPTSCCKEKFCGSQCCANGVECGPVCSPSDLGFVCCNKSSGLLCKSPDICCGEQCCPSETHTCCNGTCCEKGTTCCNGICCQAGTECCGNHCCQSGEGDVCQSSESCCPGDRICPDSLCCPAGQFCVSDANSCCDNQWCGSICCHKGSTCNAAGGCCQDGQVFCPYGTRNNCFNPPYSVCCPTGGACTADFPLCSGNSCCPQGYPTLCASQGYCHSEGNGSCQCCGTSGCCYPPYTCQSDGSCKYCHKDSHWWSHKIVCDPQPGGGDKPATPISQAHLVEESGKQTASLMSQIIQKRASKTSPDGTVLPPAPSKILSPDSFACFANKTALNDTCYAFNCLYTMSQCGATGYLATARQLYCIGAEATRQYFTAPGQVFLSCMQSCITTAHVQVYSHGVLPCCNSLETWGEGAVQENCFLNCGFCHVFIQNAGAFEELFLANSLSNVYDIFFKYCNIGDEKKQ